MYFQRPIFSIICIQAFETNNVQKRCLFPPANKYLAPLGILTRSSQKTPLIDRKLPFYLLLRINYYRFFQAEDANLLALAYSDKDNY